MPIQLGVVAQSSEMIFHSGSFFRVHVREPSLDQVRIAESPESFGAWVSEFLVVLVF